MKSLLLSLMLMFMSVANAAVATAYLVNSQHMGNGWIRCYYTYMLQSYVVTVPDTRGCAHALRIETYHF